MTARRLYARKCTVRALTEGEANDFVDMHHRQGSAQISTKLTSLGLYSGSELVAVAQFCAPRTAQKARQYSTELLRLAFPDDVRVVGGASKLIKHYIKINKPADLFTYQSMEGEGGAVYEKSGLTLVSQAKSKAYLVAPGKTLETASRKERLSMAYASRYGPDRILGTKLGEVFHKDGRRKTNPELFSDVLGWHIEKTAGDKVYEWVNPDMTFYVYRITASDSKKYYIGVSHIKKANATPDDCLAMDYWGSGGPKFKRWRAKHRPNLEKEILKTFARKAPAFHHEATILGDSFRSDPFCLNVTRGGTGSVGNQGSTIMERHCDVCARPTKHKGRTCFACTNGKSISKVYCELCGEVTKHIGESCYSCAASRGKTKEWCDVCGEIRSHKAGVCSRCQARKSEAQVFCDKCGEVTFHRGKTCIKCPQRKLVKVEYCRLCDAETKHRGETCYGCMNRSGLTLQHCEKCEMETNHRGETCSRCTVKSSIAFRHCSICEKMTSHKGSSCSTCAAKKFTMLPCIECKRDTKHRGSSCSSCLARRAAHTRFHAKKPKDDCLLCTSER